MDKVKLGIVITARDTFPPRNYALENARRIREQLRGIFEAMPYVQPIWTDQLLGDGMATTLKEAEKVSEYFKSQKADAVFVPHANFGQEETVGIIADNLRLPVLIWGPRDGSPDPDAPFRQTDTQCGMFATTRLLLRYGLPYTYLRNCWLDSSELEKGIDDFIRVASIVKAFRRLRVMQLSTRPRQFLSVKVNEGELLERFGIHVVPIESVEIVSRIDGFIAERTASKKLVSEWKEQGILFRGASESELINIAAIVLAILSMAEQYGCSAVASECWSLLRAHYQVSGCFAFGYLSQLGLPVCCENDIHGAISSVLAQAASLYRTPSFLADITVRHPQNDNAELLWHCGPFPPALAKREAFVEKGQGQYQLKNGGLTLIRFDADHQTYSLFAEECQTTYGPATTGNYVWIETKDWGRWEDKLMYGPYIHHIAGVYGSYKDVLREACKYLGVSFDCVF